MGLLGFNKIRRMKAARPTDRQVQETAPVVEHHEDVKVAEVKPAKEKQHKEKKSFEEQPKEKEASDKDLF